MKSRMMSMLAAVTVVVIATMSLVMFTSQKAPTPPLFLEPTYTYESAQAAEKAQHKPVLLLASASWCGPCQEFKRTALLDKKVYEIFREKTLPVYLDTDEHPDVAGEIKVTSIPTLYLIREGQIVSKLSGNQSAADVVDWLNAALAQK